MEEDREEVAVAVLPEVAVVVPEEVAVAVEDAKQNYPQKVIRLFCTMC